MTSEEFKATLVLLGYKQNENYCNNFRLYNNSITVGNNFSYLQVDGNLVGGTWTFDYLLKQLVE